MAASKKSRSLRLRNICVGALTVVICRRCGFRGRAVLPSVLDSAETLGDERDALERMEIRVLNIESTS